MSKRILIVDNDRDLLDIVEEVLHYESFEVTTAEGTEDIVSLISQTQPHLLLIDYWLAGSNGGELCAQLKMGAKTNKVPVIIFSACSNKKLKPGSYGCDDFLAKPFNLEDLIAKIKTLIYSKPGFFWSE